MSTLYRIALVLVIIGAVNWGLIGFFQFDLVASLFGGQDATLSRWVYAAVGIAGLISIPLLAKSFDEVDTRDDRQYRDARASYSMEASDEFGIDNELRHQRRDKHKD